MEILISIVDDDDDFREALAAFVRSLNYKVQTFGSGTDFLASPTVRNTACLIADIHMPTMTGVELHSRVVASGHAIPTILVTGYQDDGVRARALAGGVMSYLVKPFDNDVLRDRIRAALEKPKPHVS